METGPINSSVVSDPWQARWCWSELRLARPWNSVVYFRRTIELPDKPTSALVRVSADSRYSLWVNGRWVHFGPARCTPGAQSFDTIDLADALHAGTNCIAAIVQQFGVPTAQSVYRDAAGFILDGSARTSGGVIPLHTPEGWLCHEATSWRKNVARLGDGLGFQEHLDADAEPGEWMLPEYVASEQSGWTAPVAVAPAGGHPWTKMVPRGVPLLVGQIQPFAQIVAQFTGQNARGYKVAEDVLVPFAQEARKKVKTGLDNPDALLRDDDQPGTIKPPPDGNFHMLVLDLGKTQMCNLVINISQAAGDEFIDVIYSQELDKASVPVSAPRMAQGDRYRCRPGAQRWETLVPRGFRYAGMVFRNVTKPLAIRNIGVRTVRAALEQVGNFECSDPVLNQIYQAGVSTLRACMMDAYIDCPQRSQAQRWQDARVQFRAAACVFGDVSLLERGIVQMAQSQTSDGSLHGFPPSEDPHGRTIDANLAWIQTLWDHHVYTGRTDLLESCRPVMERLLEFFAAHRTADGWIGSFDGYELCLDRNIRREDVSAALNLLYVIAMQCVEQIYEALGEPEQARLVQSQREALAQSLHQKLWDEKLKTWHDGFDPATGKAVDPVSVETCALAILAGLGPEIPELACRDMLLKPMIARRGKIITATPYSASYVLDALLGKSLTAEAMELVKNRWGGMVAAGAATLWENWDGAQGSRCFGSSSAPLYVLAQQVLGVTQMGTGWRRIRIAPWVGALEFARGTVPSPLGPIRVEWEKVAEDQLAVRVDLPEGMEAEFVTSLKQTRELGAGTSEFHT